jgi:hypothetical protein
MEKAKLSERSEFFAFFIGVSPSGLPLDILSHVTRKLSPTLLIPLDFSHHRAYNGCIETDEEE